MRILYFTQDVTDALTAKRISMLRSIGSDVGCYGLSRNTNTATSSRYPVQILAYAKNARLMARFRAIAVALVRLILIGRQDVASASIIVARNLDMVIIASVARAFIASRSKIYYECLDIHPQLTASTIMGSVLRFFERRILATCSGIIVSSPAFLDHYFRPQQGYCGETWVLENKVWLEGCTGVGKRKNVDRKPERWRIGYVGLFRCRRSLIALGNLARRRKDVEIVLHGVPDRHFIPDFEELISGAKRIRYCGKYDNLVDLPRIYDDLDFSWTGDLSAVGQNSEWLLPNRIYEAIAFGAIPIALDGTETANWLKKRKIGIILNQNIELALESALSIMDWSSFAAMLRSVKALPESSSIVTQGDIARLIQWMTDGGTR